MTTVVNAGSVRNRFDAFNIKCAELRDAMNENLDTAKKLKKRHLLYKSEYGVNDQLTVNLKSRALKFWGKSEEYRLKLEAFENKFNPEKNNKVKYNLKTCKFYISK